MKMLVVLLVLVVVLETRASVAPGENATSLKQWRVRYLLRTEKNGDSLHDVFEHHVDERILEDLSASDDTPMAAVPLTFDFPFFGKARRTGFVNANGAIGFEPKPPCGTYFGSVQRGAECSLNTSWYDLVAGLVTDLNPSSEGHIVVGQGVDRAHRKVKVMTAAFENVTLFDADARERDLSMAMSIYEDGRVEIHHVKVFDDDAIAGLHGLPSAMVVGLRPPAPGSFSESAFALTESQVARRKSWDTSVNGVYAGAAPHDHRRTVACPVPSDEEHYCAEIVDLAFVDDSTQKGAEAVLGVQIVAPFFGCAAETRFFGFFCALVEEHSAGGERAFVARSSLATFSNLTDDAGGPSVALCDFNESDDADVAREALERAILATATAAPPPSSKNASDTSLASLVGQGEPTSRNATTDDPAPTTVLKVELRYESSLTMDTYDGGEGDGGYPTTHVGERSVLATALPLTTLLDDAASATDSFFCGAAWLSTFEPYPFPVLDCDNAPTVEDEAFVDDTGTCCDYKDSDCLGVCFGSAVARTVGAGGVVSCCNFDCKDDCNGAAEPDDCGVCEGGDAAKDKCGVCFGPNEFSCPFADDDDGDGDRSSGHEGSGGGSKKSSSSSRRASRVANSIHDHPWVVVIVALEIFVSIACFRSCTSRRGLHVRGANEAPRDLDGSWADAHPDFPAGASLAPRDLDHLVHAALRDFPSVRARSREESSNVLLFFSSSPAATTSRRPAPPPLRSRLRSLFGVGVTPRVENAGNDEEHPVDDGVVFGAASLRGLRASVSEAYQGAVTTLCATPRHADFGSAPPPVFSADEILCGICLDELADRRTVSLPNCGHAFHAACLAPWLTAHNSCPFCKRTVVDRVTLPRADDDDDPPARRSSAPAWRRRSRRGASGLEMQSLGSGSSIAEEDPVGRGTDDDGLQLDGAADRHSRAQETGPIAVDLDDDLDDLDDDDDDDDHGRRPASPPTPHPASSFSSATPPPTF